MEYKNIGMCLSGYWETPWAKLPDEQRQAWHESLGLVGGNADTDGRRWDAQRVEERQYVVDWYDCGHDPAREGERNVAEHDLWMDASTHMQMKDVTPRNAAMLLCRINPLEEKDPEKVYVDGDESSPKRFSLLLLAFDDEARTSPKHRTLLEWRAVAQQRGLRYHPWIDVYENSGGLVALAKTQATTEATESAEPPSPINLSERKRGITKAEILAAEWPMPNDAPSLESILDKIPKYVDEACIKVGRAGKGQSGSHLWSPAVLAVCLAIRTPHKQWICNQVALTNLIRSQFPDFLDEWTDKQVML